MEELSQVERLARVEGKLDMINTTLVGINAKLDAMNELYVPRNEIDEMFRARDRELDRIEQRATGLRSLWPAWIGVIVAAAALLISLWQQPK